MDEVPPLTDAEKEGRAQRRQELGARLRSLREAKGMTLISLSQATRINRNFLDALEKGAFEKLPGDVFARGFVRCIARSFQEDPEHWVAAFDELCEKAVPPKSVLEVEIKNRPTISRGDTIRTLLVDFTSLMRRGLGLRLAAAGLVIAALGFGAFRFVGVHRRPGGFFDRDTARSFNPQDVTGKIPSSSDALEPKSPTSGAPTTTFVTPEPGVIAGATTSVVETAAAPKAPAAAQDGSGSDGVKGIGAGSAADSIDAPKKSDEPALAAETTTDVVAAAPVVASGAVGGATGGDQVLELTVIEPVRVRMDVDNGTSFVKDLKPDVYRYSFHQKADVLIYDAAALKISFNGRSLGALGNKGRVRRISFQAQAPSEKKL